MRLIARLDVKNQFVIKGIHLEGLRKVGNPNDLANEYYRQGADELLFVDSVASLYDRNNLFQVIERAAEEVFIPITIAGGLRKIEDVKSALDSGADKISVNTASVEHPGFIEQIAGLYGSQCVVASVQAKRSEGRWEAYVETGRQKTGLDVLEWVRKLEQLGAGEILLTSVDQEGTKSGFDVALAKTVNEAVGVPVILSGGYGRPEHIAKLLDSVKPSALCFASVLHYGLSSFEEIREVVESSELRLAGAL